MINALRIPDEYVVVRVSSRKYRLARVTSKGEDYNMGFTNLREVVMEGDKMSRQELFLALSKLPCTPDKYDDNPSKYKHE